MNLLIDTHVFLWMIDDEQRLTTSARDALMGSGEAAEAAIQALSADATRHRIFRATDTDEYWLIPMDEAGSEAVKIYPQAGAGGGALVSLSLKSQTSNAFQVSGGTHHHQAPVVYHPTSTGHHNQYQRNFCGFCIHDPNEVSDPENCWDTGNDRFTAPRTGNYRLGADELLVDAAGISKISMEDAAVALLDEAERPRHHQTRFTAAY